MGSRSSMSDLSQSLRTSSSNFKLPNSRKCRRNKQRKAYKKYVRSLYHDDAYGDETACGKEAMGKRKMDLMRRINTLMVFEKQQTAKYPDHDMPDDDYSPAILIRAMQAKVDKYEKKLSNIRHSERTLKESDASSGEEAEDQYVDTQPRAQAGYISDDDPEYDGRRKQRTLNDSRVIPDKRVARLSGLLKQPLLDRPNSSCSSKRQSLVSPNQDPGFRDAVAKFRKDAYSYEPATNKADITKRRGKIVALMDKLIAIKEQHEMDYPRDVILGNRNSPEALIAAFQDKIDSLEWKLLKLAQATSSSCSQGRRPPSADMRVHNQHHVESLRARIDRSKTSLDL